MLFLSLLISELRLSRLTQAPCAKGASKYSLSKECFLAKPWVFQCPPSRVSGLLWSEWVYESPSTCLYNF